MAMYMKDPVSETVHADAYTVGATRFVVAGATVLLLLLGVWPAPALDMAERGAEGLRPIVMVASTK